jgi:hypothetical protein
MVRALGRTLLVGVAGVAVLAVGACSSDDDPATADTTSTSPASTTPGSTTPSSSAPTATTNPPAANDVTELLPEEDFGTVGGGGRFATGHAAEELDVGFLFEQSEEPGPAVLRFSSDLGTPDCIEQATLTFHISSEPPSVGVSVYAGDPAVLTLEDGDPIDASVGTLLDNRPRGTVTFDGEVGEADITAVVKMWLQGGPFPSTGRTVDPTALLALVLQPDSAKAGTAFRLLTGDSDEATRPKLAVSTTC